MASVKERLFCESVFSGVFRIKALSPISIRISGCQCALNIHSVTSVRRVQSKRMSQVACDLFTVMFLMNLLIRRSGTFYFGFTH